MPSVPVLPSVYAPKHENSPPLYGHRLRLAAKFLAVRSQLPDTHIYSLLFKIYILFHMRSNLQQILTRKYRFISTPHHYTIYSCLAFQPSSGYLGPNLTLQGVHLTLNSFHSLLQDDRSPIEVHSLLHRKIKTKEQSLSSLVILIVTVTLPPSSPPNYKSSSTVSNQYSPTYQQLSHLMLNNLSLIHISEPTRPY